MCRGAKLFPARFLESNKKKGSLQKLVGVRFSKVHVFCVLKGAVGRQVGDVAAAVLSELKMKNTISNPEVFHYLPEPLSHHVTLVYSKAATMSSFETFRRSLHTSFLLPQDRPLFRRSNSRRNAILSLSE